VKPCNFGNSELRYATATSTVALTWKDITDDRGLAVSSWKSSSTCAVVGIRRMSCTACVCCVEMGTWAVSTGTEAAHGEGENGLQSARVMQRCVLRAETSRAQLLLYRVTP